MGGFRRDGGVGCRRRIHHSSDIQCIDIVCRVNFDLNLDTRKFAGETNLRQHRIAKIQ